jgi:probable F420-dependent oxidoreductase
VPDAITPTLSLALPNFAADDPGGWDHLVDRAQVADAAGVDRLVVFDHVVFGEHLDAYGRPEVGGTVGGRQPTGPDGHWLEPLTLLSFVAGTTARIRLATGILIAALRRPVVLAKTAATLDVLSGGRLDLGVGVGWQREEYDAAGLSFDGRGRVLDETLAVCQALWREQDATIEVGGHPIAHVHQMPKPLQPGGVPIWVSGTLNPRVIARVVRFGSGWIPWGPDALDPTAGLARLREAMEAAGRSEPLQVAGTLPAVKDDSGTVDLDRTMDGVPALVEAGVTDLRIPFAVPRDRAEAGDHLAEVVTAFRAAVGR